MQTQWTYPSERMSELRPDLASLRGRQKWRERITAPAGSYGSPTSTKRVAYVSQTSGSWLQLSDTWTVAKFLSASQRRGMN